MKQRGTLLVIFIVLVVLSKAFSLPDARFHSVENGYQLELDFPTIVVDEQNINCITSEGRVVNEIFQTLSIPGYNYYGVVGGPALPFSTFHVALENEIPKIELSNVVTEKLVLSNRLMPLQPERCACGQHINPAFTYNSKFYTNTYATQDPVVSIDNVYMYRGQKAATIAIKPIHYDPASNEITYIRHATVSFTMTKPTTVQSWNSKQFDMIMRELFINVETVRSEPFNSKEKYLIITQPEYKDNADLKKFIAYKSNYYTMKMVTTSEVGGSTKENFRTYIKNEKPTFCLLIGVNANFPAHEVTFGGKKIKTYQYYGATQIASETKRPLPDIAIGLFYVNNATEIANIVNKTIKTEENLNSMPKSYVGQGGNTADMKPLPAAHCDSVILNVSDKFFKPNNSFKSTVYFSTKNEGGNKKLVDDINGGIRFYGYNGHGSETGTSFGFNASDLSSMTNTIYPFAQISACLTGTFTRNCVAAAAVAHKNATVTFIGAYEPSSLGQHILSRGYFEAIMKKNITKSGTAFVYATNSDSSFTCITKYCPVNYEPTNAGMGWQYHHFGDPSIETMSMQATQSIPTVLSAAFHSNIRIQGSKMWFQFPEHAKSNIATISLFNAQGRQLQTVVTHPMKSGNHVIDIPALSAGLYIITLEIDGRIQRNNLLYTK